MSRAEDFAHAYCRQPAESVLQRAGAVTWLILDADGVLTDGAIVTGPSGEDIKAFHVHDGKGLALMRSAGIGVAIVTARESQALTARAAELGIGELRQGVQDKATALAELSATYRVAPDSMAYVGDDIVDLGAMARVGLAIAVADAHPLAASRSHWITQRAGGRGAVREACELILAARGELAAIFRNHE
jgi:3-deoxy-D-manno-octulosonate 8-phosphate phosphatase (KDO 8-P phosphatase)